MAQVVWPRTLLEVLEELPGKERELILDRVDRLERFPKMYPVRMEGRFRGYRWFFAGNWLVYYRVVEQTVYLRAIWPSRVP